MRRKGRREGNGLGADIDSDQGVRRGNYLRRLRVTTAGSPHADHFDGFG